MERLVEKQECGELFCKYDSYKCIDQEEDGGCQYCEHFSNILKKLHDYEYAEEQGLLLRLPCKVGDMVWLLQEKCKHAGANNEPWGNCNQYWDNVSKKGMWGCAGKDDQGNSLICEKKEMELYARQMEYTLFLYIPNIVFGKNLFLTKAEAEKALEEMG